MKAQTNHAIRNNKFPQSLRRNPTDAERLLWRYLRGRQLHGFNFRRQHPFGDYILDFVSLDAGLVIEVDGGQHAEMNQQDAVRSAFLEQAGFQALRFWNNQVLCERDAVLAAISSALMQRSPPHPHPSPPLGGEGAVT